ncbi:MAG: cyclophilin-like fold protein [Candidatus Nezhaarchaeota archaeon]|nr:cyclophilin-like fold protein [Candidatus Nezhaarchaeota archaeon]MCX8141320.1 cyclophilin-like fold protein [Candidatus Nezhaarchaeota archaeon]MDW8049586.1 cyclophilin-like fold protein [Nitrososphaerota archaeon]
MYRKPVKVRVAFESGLTVEFLVNFEENPRTAEVLMMSLPFESRAELWGEELYFSVPFSVGPENTRDVVDVGDVAYWPEEPSLCLFFGPTPISPEPDIIKPYSPVNVIGKIVGDPKVLRKVREGEGLRVYMA